MFFVNVIIASAKKISKMKYRKMKNNYKKNIILLHKEFIKMMHVCSVRRRNT